MLFEQYIMALNWEKYDIEVWDDDTIKRKRILFDFMQQMFNRLDGLYMDEKWLFIYTIKISVEEAECSGSWNTEQKKRTEKKEGISKPSPKNPVF